MSTAILVTARLKSTRLERKALKPIVGRPIVGHLVDRLRRVNSADRIVICTSTVAQDDALEAWARSEGVDCFRGDPDDVLARLTAAAIAFDAETVVSCTADNPFVSPEHVDELVTFHHAGSCDYSRVEGLPFGAFSYALRVEAMKEASRLADTSDTEVWGGYFSETGKFRCGIMSVTDPRVSWPELRLTIDTPEDFEFASHIFAELYTPGEVFPLRDVVALCRDHPELVAINRSVTQKPAAPIRVKVDR